MIAASAVLPTAGWDDHGSPSTRPVYGLVKPSSDGTAGIALRSASRQTSQDRLRLSGQPWTERKHRNNMTACQARHS